MPLNTHGMPINYLLQPHVKEYGSADNISTVYERPVGQKELSFEVNTVGEKLTTSNCKADDYNIEDPRPKSLMSIILKSLILTIPV